MGWRNRTRKRVEGSALTPARKITDHMIRAGRHPPAGIALVLILAGLILAGTAAAAPGWKFRADLPNTGNYDDGGTRPQPVEYWQFNTGSLITGSPVVHEGTVFFGSANGKVYALDAGTGTRLWAVQTGAAGFSGPAAWNGTLFIVGNNGIFYALNSSNGSAEWHFPSGSTVTTIPTVTGRMVFFGNRDGNLYALNATTGDIVWNTSTGRAPAGCPAISGDILYVGTYCEELSGYHNATLFALNATTGAGIWNRTIRTEFNGGSLSSPAVANGTVFIGGNFLYALDALTGEEQWSTNGTSVSHDVRSSPVVNNSTVFSASHSSFNITALDTETGNVRWSYKAAGSVDQSPAVANGILYISAENWSNGNKDDLFAFDARTGAKVWNFTTGYSYGGSPVIADGTVYYGSGTRMYAIGSVPPPTPSVGYPDFSEWYVGIGFWNQARIPGTNFAPTALTRLRLTRGNIEGDSRPFESIEVTSFTVTGSTNITCSFFIPPGTAEGYWTAEVTNLTNGRTGYNQQAFCAEMPQPPAIASMSPSNGTRGDTVSFSLGGTNFRAGCTVNLTNGTYPANLTATTGTVNRTTVLGSFAIPTDAPVGTWNVTLTNSDGQFSVLADGFRIRESNLAVQAITPKTGRQGTTVTVKKLAGTDFQHGAGVTLSKAGKTIRMKPATVVSPTKITGKVKIPAKAKTGKYTVTVTNPDGQNATLPNGFTVKAS